MLIPSYTKQFAKDFKKMQKRGKSTEKIKKIIRKLVNEEPLAASYKEHKLIGNFKGRRECHIEPDWLLIYKIVEPEIIFERTGSIPCQPTIYPVVKDEPRADLTPQDPSTPQRGVPQFFIDIMEKGYILCLYYYLR